MLGKDLLIALGGKVIAAQRTCNLNLQQDTIEVCSPVSGPWREYIPGTLGWDVSCDGLIYAPEYADELMDVLTSRQKVRLSYYDPEMRIVRSGYAIPTGLQQGASISDLASYSLTFIGSGPLEKVEREKMKIAIPEGIVLAKYGYLTDENHRMMYIQGTVGGSYIRPVQFDVLTKLIIDYPNGVCVLYDSDPTEFIKAENNLWLYNHEVIHALRGSASALLIPGKTYYVVGPIPIIQPTIHDDDMFFDIYALSLPVE